jgi:hypothetical protein
VWGGLGNDAYVDVYVLINGNYTLNCGVSAGGSCQSLFSTVPVSAGDRVSLAMYYYNYNYGPSFSSVMRINYSIELHPVPPG